MRPLLMTSSNTHSPATRSGTREIDGECPWPYGCASSGGPRNLFIDAPAPVSDSTRAVDKFNRTPSVVNAVASTVRRQSAGEFCRHGKPNRGNDIKESINTRPVTRVAGLPDTTAPSNPNKYMIETNPVLTDLKSFMSSDYLLGKLGYDPDQSAKRLGDGLYEQRLIQQAVTARTGQAFLDGQTSNEGMFKYLMNRERFQGCTEYAFRYRSL